LRFIALLTEFIIALSDYFGVLSARLEVRRSGMGASAGC
jgi:hypothetical protein